MHPTLIKALESLSVTCNKSTLHPSDEDRVKVTFRTLHKNGISLTPSLLEQWLTENSWQAKPIKEIVSWATAISSGGRVQLKNKTTAPTEKQIWQKLNT